MLLVRDREAMCLLFLFVLALSLCEGLLQQPHKVGSSMAATATAEAKGEKRWSRPGGDNSNRQRVEQRGGGGGGGSGGGGDMLQSEWKSGHVFNNNKPRTRRNDPWWMRDEEKTNPRVLPVYKPWWLQDNKVVDESWKVVDLRAEATRRGIMNVSSMKKAELIDKLVESSKLYTLGNEGYREPVFVPKKGISDLPPCYPDIYEGGPEQIEALKNKLMLNTPAPPARKEKA